MRVGDPKRRVRIEPKLKPAPEPPEEKTRRPAWRPRPAPQRA